MKSEIEATDLRFPDYCAYAIKQTGIGAARVMFALVPKRRDWVNKTLKTRSQFHQPSKTIFYAGCARKFLARIRNTRAAALALIPANSRTG